MPYSDLTGLAFSPDGRTLAAGGDKTYLTLWNTRDGRQRRTIETPEWPYGIGYSPDGRQLVMGDKLGAFV